MKNLILTWIFNEKACNMMENSISNNFNLQYYIDIIDNNNNDNNKFNYLSNNTV